ncbi:MAG: hypothetical protein WCD04_18985 [Terriglobia bacterium]|jgi:hypothetical protein
MPAVGLVSEDGCRGGIEQGLRQRREVFWCPAWRRFSNLFLGLVQDKAALLTKPAALGLRGLAQITRLELPRGTIRTEVEKPFTCEITILRAVLADFLGKLDVLTNLANTLLELRFER